MSDKDVYKPVAAQATAITDKRSIKTGVKIVLLLIGLRAILDFINTPQASEFVSVGFVSVMGLVIYFLSVLLVGVGGLLLAFKSKAATIVFGAAAALAILAAWQWLPLFSGWPNQPLGIDPQSASPSIMWQLQPIVLIGGILLAGWACFVSFKQHAR